ncbi:glycine-rich RNA-binding protein 2-like [Homarus americanus]|uniref:glycine-rich RNA-binding protein 2-like n=1 Tax=Homarus americanus TaxID=6706 RepID=UPI001C4497F9|nr:glycine-rich RNA-binding protein 2-like [Homarus americanus]
MYKMVIAVLSVSLLMAAVMADSIPDPGYGGRGHGGYERYDDIYGGHNYGHGGRGDYGHGGRGDYVYGGRDDYGYGGRGYHGHGGYGGYRG